MASPRTPPLHEETLDISFATDMLSPLLRGFKQHGDAFRIRASQTTREILVLSHPDHARHILIAHHQKYVKGIGIERVGILLGNGIMVSEGELWRRQRKMLQPAFHRNVISGMTSDICKTNARLLEKWAKCATQHQSIDLTQDTSETTLSIVLNAIFGPDITTMTGPEGVNPFTLLTDEGERNLTFAYKFRSLSNLIAGCIERRRRECLDRQDLLAMLMMARDRKSGHAMTEKQLLDEVMTLIVAGHETTASALNWIWYLLSQHPLVEQRLHQEIDTLSLSPTGSTNLVQFKYTRQVIDEALRLYPPGWLLTRRSISEDNIAGHEIGPNTDVFLSPYLIHRHPAFWNNPEVFDPDRFSSANSAIQNRCAYLPFSLGPRACIGEQFAMIEMLLHMAIIARNISLTHAGTTPPQLECRVNLRSMASIMMKPHLRHS